MTDHLINICNTLVDINDYRLTVSVSIGIALYPDDLEDGTTQSAAIELLQSADTAMYHAKENGKNKYSFFCDMASSFRKSRVVLHQVLRDALNNQEFVAPLPTYIQTV